ncbi:MAG: alkyl hydroperoxide reductase/Thiol specific antioxidant/Mal allergen [Gemmatimonadetes bacterium]|nr:alkyl hydroperoxide reductase/Thiol specific antioxidant/Mal allergen [Gemmatimonadota bacterium]
MDAVVYSRVGGKGISGSRGGSLSQLLPGWIAVKLRMMLAGFGSIAGAVGASAAQQPTARAVGMPAPGFTLPSAGEAGPGRAVSLHDFKGRVVVIAFYPGDKTTGCTAELSKFRDEYDSLFGSDVAVLPISTDGLASHASWASEMHFPFTLLSDTAQTVASAYGSTLAGRPFDNRTIFVVGRDGRIAYRQMKFSALSETAYRDLANAVAAAKGGP